MINRLTDEISKKKLVFLELLPFAYLDIERCNQVITKITIARFHTWSADRG